MFASIIGIGLVGLVIVGAIVGTVLFLRRNPAIQSKINTGVNDINTLVAKPPVSGPTGPSSPAK